MKLKIYSIYDSKAKVYNQPFFARTKGEAIRSFTQAANDGNTMFCKYPEDYSLFEIGEIDMETATITPNAPHSCGGAWELKKPVETVSHLRNQPLNLESVTQ